MEEERYTLTRLRALMDQDQARLAEAHNLGTRWVEKQSNAHLARSYLLLGGLVLVNVLLFTFQRNITPHLLLGAGILFAVAFVTTYLYPLGAKWEWEAFLKGEEAYLQSTWKTSVHPEVSLWLDAELDLYEVTVHSQGESYSLGCVEKKSSFIEDFNSFLP